ncbi:hypothetical protein [Streptomyces mutomycini]|uniref:hypothetical protein n=1 Tax=Streptomyces mutomycini TaxID=284036 RepID=UPI00340B0215
MGISGATVNDVRDDGAAAEEPDTDRSGRPRSDGAPITLQGPTGSGGASLTPAGGDVPGSCFEVPPARPVFVDTTGRRGRTWRRTGVVTALCCAAYATTVAAALVGGDSNAPYLQLPRMMGLEREVDEQSARSRDEERAAPVAEPVPTAPGPAAPGPGVSGQALSDPADPSAAVGVHVPQPLEVSADPVGIPVAAGRPAAPAPGGQVAAPPASGGGTQSGESAQGATEKPSSPAPEGGSGSGSEEATGGGDDAHGHEADGTASPGGPLGDLLGGLLGGLLGSP